MAHRGTSGVHTRPPRHESDARRWSDDHKGVGLASVDSSGERRPIAQTNRDLSPVSPRISGNVLRVLVEEHDYVRAGTELVNIDPTDYRLALAQAQAPGLIYQQAPVVAYEYVFALLALVFAVCLPLLLLIRFPTVGAGSAGL